MCPSCHAIMKLQPTEHNSENCEMRLISKAIHNTIQCNAMQLYHATALRWDEMQCIAMQYTTAQYNTVEYEQCVIYTVNHKKRDILFFTITLANLNRFLQFLCHFNREEILHATIIKPITSLDLCEHLTWKNQNLHFCRGS